MVLSIESAVALRDWLSCATIYSYLYSCFRGGKDEFQMFFPSCQVSVVRFYVSLLRFLLLLFFFLVLLRLLRRRAVQCPVSAGNCDHRRSVFPAGPQPRPSVLSVPSRTSTATICAQCSLPDLNRDHLCSVFQAGPQPRPSVLSVPSRTSTATICTQCSLPDLDRDRNNFSHDRILSSLKRCLSGIALMFGPRSILCVVMIRIL